MALFDRILGIDAANPQISIHGFQAVVSEWARGQLTGAQAQNAISVISGAPLTAGEVTEAQALVNTVPAGATTANKADRALRLQEIDQVLLLAGTPPYTTSAALKTRLGV